MSLSDTQRRFLIELLKNGETIPEDFKYYLFPTLQAEYELSYAGKMRREDILSNQDGTFPVPLQLDTKFYAYGKENNSWENLIVFGDNLQLLKTIYENKDPVIKDKVKGKVKLIYIDPPFATQDEFTSKLGAKAYSDKKEGAEFIEFIRRRLIVAREILAEDGSIFIHLDQKMSHYIKVVMDEIFGKNSFRNEISWHYASGGNPNDRFKKNHDHILFYAKSDNSIFNIQKQPPSNPKRYNLTDEDGKKYMINYGKKYFLDDGNDADDVWSYLLQKEYGILNSQAKERIGYPTQKPESLLKRIILATTNPGDIVLDFFGGSGTTMSVAEKTDRKWIICDLGKLAYLTMQKRMLQIKESNSILKSGNYGFNPKPFATYKLGVYDLKTTLKMEWEKYNHFVSQLFEFELNERIINGYKFEGIKRNNPVKVFNFEKYEGIAIDELFLKNISNTLGSSKPSTIYIVSPATKVRFISDFFDLDGTRFYFLKVPYEMIEELHTHSFEKIRQPRSKSSINDIEEMKGFQFIYAPEVECNLSVENDEAIFTVTKFESTSLDNFDLGNFSTLASIYVNYSYNDEYFILDDALFWDEIESDSKKFKDSKIHYDSKENIEKITWKFDSKLLGEKTAFVLTDISGNDFVVELSKEV